MMRRLLRLLALAGIAAPLLAAGSGDAETAITTASFAVEHTAIASPAGPGATAPGLTRGADGSLWLTWLEPKGDGVTALRAAKFNPATSAWGETREIAAGRDWFVNWADTPVFAAEADGRLTAVWFVNNPTAAHGHGHGGHHGAGYQAWFARSTDDGATWSEPARLTEESDKVEFVALQPLAHGGLLAVWLDGRAKGGDAAAMRLYGRALDREGPDRLIDGSVCDCCPTTLTAFPDGSALVAYRARREGEVRDIHTARFRAGEWSEPRLLSADDWQIPGCPVNGPRLAGTGGQIAAAWFTAADDQPRVLASASPDAGARWLLPQRLDLGDPLGRVDTVLLQDGSRLVIWLEAAGKNEAGIYLRRISAADEIGPPVLLASSTTARASGFPRLALVKDYDATPAQLLLAYTEDRQPPAVHTRLLTLPTLSALAGRKPCLPCDEDDANAVRGYAMKGVVSQVQQTRDLIWVKIEEIPGVMRATSLACRAEAALFGQLSPGQSLLGRIEKRGRDWWLFNVKLLGEPAS
ncbi:MAG: hypothetical protein RLZZ129_1630 [Verrucomicrobiota bacterium]|jgi:hypothetical protein